MRKEIGKFSGLQEHLIKYEYSKKNNVQYIEERVYFRIRKLINKMWNFRFSYLLLYLIFDKNRSRLT